MDKLDFVTPLPLTRKSNFVIREPSATFPYRSRVLTTRCPNTVQELCNYYKHLCAVDERLTVVTSDMYVCVLGVLITSLLVKQCHLFPYFQLQIYCLFNLCRESQFPTIPRFCTPSWWLIASTNDASTYT
jgi:hypothetical protein